MTIKIKVFGYGKAFASSFPSGVSYHDFKKWLKTRFPEVESCRNHAITYTDEVSFSSFMQNCCNDVLLVFSSKRAD